MPLRISALTSREMLASIQALKTFDREVRKQVRQHTKTMAAPEWQKAVSEHASTRLEHRVLADTARVQVSDRNVMLQSARVGRSLAGGAKPKELAKPVEFGTARDRRRNVTQRSRAGRQYTYKRQTQRQFRPFNKSGYVVFPAAANIIPRITSLWVQTVARTFADLIETR